MFNHVGSEPIVRLRDLRKSYGPVEVLRGVGLEIFENEVFGLLGPNGAGKTTLVKILLGLTRPTGGSVEVFGLSPERDPLKVRAMVGYVMQERAIDLYLTGRENLELHARLYNLRGQLARERVEWALEWSGLAEAADRLVKFYSGGMRRRLEIAMGMLNCPRLLLLDEPTLGLDVSGRRQLWELVKRLRQTRVSVLLTTHYLEEANELCDRVCIVDSGRVVGLGTPEQLKRETVSDLHRLTVRFKEPPALDGLSLSLAPEIHEFEATFRGPPQQLWETVAALERRFGGTIEEIVYAQPTLDDVFLKLTQRQKKEEGAA